MILNYAGDNAEAQIENIISQLEMLINSNNDEDLQELYRLKLDSFKKGVSKGSDLEKAASLKMICQIDNEPELTEEDRLEIILSYGNLVDYFKKVLQGNVYTDSEIFVLAGVSKRLEPEYYHDDLTAITEKRLISSIVEKGSNLEERIEITRAIIRAHAEDELDYSDPDEYEEMVDIGIDIVDSYTFGKDKKI
jgi:hypothetical protein